MDEIHGWVTIDDGRYGYGCYVHMNRNTPFLFFAFTGWNYTGWNTWNGMRI